MAFDSLQDLYLDELADLYAAETQMMRALPRLSDAARAPELRDLLARYGDESRLHLERLQLIFTHWGERLPAGICAGVGGIVQEAEDRLNQPATDDVRDAAIIGITQRLAHYEIAAYGCARSYARRLSRPDEARLLQETLDEDGRADDRLTAIAEGHVNDDARSETDFDVSARSRTLRYVDHQQLDYRRLASDTLRIVNDAGQDLGTLAGLLMDERSTNPRYIVVDGRGLFTGRKYLLPVSHVRFDDARRVLLVDVPKDVAERYPEFDRDHFEQMTDETRQAYEASVRGLFPLAETAGSHRVAEDESVPEWLMTGVWVTVPPDRAERLSDRRVLSRP